MTAIRPDSDARASAWLDDDLSREEREAFERELASDPELAREMKALERVVGAVRALPPAEAPADFLRTVQHRIRRRSRGRYFGRRELPRYRFPYEAVINGILLGILMAVYIIAMPTPDDTPVPVAPALTARAAGPQAVRDVLERFGTVSVAAPAASGAVAFELTVPLTAVEALRAELAGRFPAVEVAVATVPDARLRLLRVKVPLLK